MKVAIFHDYFGAIGGGERVVLAMAKIFDADIITTDIDVLEKIDPSVRVISLGKTIKIPPLKQISASIKFYSCDFSSKYDFFIFSGNWAHYAAHRHQPNLWYCYTPVRAFYDLYPEFLKRLDPVTRQLFRFWVYLHRRFDQRSISHIHRIIAISRNVQNRILLYNNRKAEVIYPPVDTSLFQFIEYGNFWLSINRLYPEKRIELQVEAFRRLPEEKLVIVGGLARGDHSSNYAQKIIRDLPPNVTFRGELKDEELCDLYAHCKAHICTALDEDFGITPLEAMASGKPVVAVNDGGFKETVASDTGVLVEPSIERIIEGIQLISKNPAHYKDACTERAKVFDVKIFKEKIRNAVFNAEKTKNFPDQ